MPSTSFAPCATDDSDVDADGDARAVALACAPSWRTLARLASTCQTLNAALVNERNPLQQLDGLSVDAVREPHRNWVGTAGARYFAVVYDQALRTGRLQWGTWW
ncbi:hypothetical protein DFJ73DRAFT_774409 [Zopfochytrium polystomum]|nr:hypothetical protein DFJ73DRAFT_774409 [Zopfochytrium polystomum]